MARCWTQRLSQKAMEFGAQRKRHWNSGFFTCPKRNSSVALLSAGFMPRMRVVNPLFTYRALRPVSGWVRTTGCSARG
jgi:hypothetical protein